MPPILLLTRPLDQARQFARAVEGVRFDLRIAPLSQIVPVPFDPAAFAGAQGIVLTSANAVPMLHGIGHIAGLPAYCVGAATTRAAAAAGFAARQGGADATELASHLRTLPPQKLIHARGQDLAVDLVALLRPEGLTISAVVVYHAQALPLPDALRHEVTSGRRIVAPLFSPRAATALVQALGGVVPDTLTPVAISENCAARLPSAARGRTLIAQSPDSGGMLRATVAALSQA